MSNAHPDGKAPYTLGDDTLDGIAAGRDMSDVLRTIEAEYKEASNAAVAAVAEYKRISGEGNAAETEKALRMVMIYKIRADVYNELLSKLAQP